MPELNDDLLQELLHTFRDEAAEHLDTLNSALLHFERSVNADDRQKYIQDAFRAAHSLKGAARAVSLDDIQTIAHAMETVFQAVRDEGTTLEPEHCDLLYDSLDGIQHAINGEPIDVAFLQSRLQQVAHKENGAAHVITDSAETQPEREAPAGEPNETIRVSLRKLDDLMAEVGELLVSRISTAQRLTETRQINQRLLEWSKSWAALKVMLKQHHNPQLTDAMLYHAEVMQGVIDHFTTLEQETRRDVTRLDMVTNNLQDKVRRVRMIPFSVHTLMLERVVRDAARTEEKNVQFEMIGTDTELDKRVLELLKDPLIHLLRNAVGHGIELASERGSKSPQGKIRLLVQQRGSEVHIHVQDDGRGFQTKQLKEAYRQRYGNTAENPINLAFLPGITTSEEVNEIAGRGIGLDVVRERLERIHGRFTVNTEAGQGTTITLIVPTSLAITRMLLVEADRGNYAIPLMSVEKIVIPEHIVTVSNKPMLRLDEGNVPLVGLAALLGLRPKQTKRQQLALIVAAGDQRLAVLVDDVLTEQELAVKPIGFPVERVRNVTGAALMGNGDPVVVLNPADFIHTYRGTSPTLPEVLRPDEQPQAPAIRVLVVDDSITTRTLERNILEAAGYDVMTATDGAEALSRLQDQPVDVVVSDIEMPNMDGFTLTQTLREMNEFAHLPVILVTSLEREQDRERGMVAGANAYIVKRGFDQAELLTTIDQLT